MGAWYLRSKYSIFDKLYPWYTKKDLDGFPLRQFNKKTRAKMSTLVARMLSLSTKIEKSKMAHERNVLKRQITATERQIDQLVYGLYGLSPQQIAIIEGTSPQAVETEKEDRRPATRPTVKPH
jgi:hypothetical protein